MNSSNSFPLNKSSIGKNLKNPVKYLNFKDAFDYYSSLDSIEDSPQFSGGVDSHFLWKSEGGILSNSQNSSVFNSQNMWKTKGVGSSNINTCSILARIIRVNNEFLKGRHKLNERTIEFIKRHVKKMDDLPLTKDSVSLSSENTFLSILREVFSRFRSSLSQRYIYFFFYFFIFHFLVNDDLKRKILILFSQIVFSINLLIY
jgi:hypothetical protein